MVARSPAALREDSDRGSEDRGDWITRVGLGADVGLAFVKFFFGSLSHSPALIADAGHSVSDVIGDAVALAALRLA